MHTLSWNMHMESAFAKRLAIYSLLSMAVAGCLRHVYRAEYTGQITAVQECQAWPCTAEGS